MEFANLFESSSLLLVLMPTLHPRYVANLTIGTCVLSPECMFAFWSVVMNSHLCLFSFETCLNRSSSISFVN